jgi:hypothetical protein
VAEYQLAHQDWIGIGKHILIVDLYETLSLELTRQMLKVGTSSTMDAESTMMIDRSDNSGRMQGIDYLTFLSDDRDDFELSNKMVTIGKNADADIVISGFWSLLAGNPSATIGKQDADYFLDYVTGLIKPRVNGNPVKSLTKLNHHDLITIGPLTMQLYRITQGG